MRKYLLDTSPLAAYLQQREPAVNIIRPLIKRPEVTTSIIVYAEVTEYIKGLSHSTQRHFELRQLLREIYPYFLTYPILERYADIRRTLRPPYGNGLIGDMDTLIAATAIERSHPLITTDRDFERVPHLKTKLISLKAA
jgi:predicted nucleic acid-binding protein